MQPGSGGGGGGGSPDPISMAAQAFSTMVKGIDAQRADSFNQKIAEENATLANQAGASQMAASDAAYRGREGQQIAAIGGSGLEMGTGSALQAVAQSRVMQTLSAMQISRDAQVKAMAYNEQAEMDKFKATNDLLMGGTQAASGMLNTQADYANQWNASGYGGSPGAGALQPASMSNQGIGGNG